jgi:hypothetical protein
VLRTISWTLASFLCAWSVAVTRALLLLPLAVLAGLVAPVISMAPRAIKSLCIRLVRYERPGIHYDTSLQFYITLYLSFNPGDTLGVDNPCSDDVYIGRCTGGGKTLRV